MAGGGRQNIPLVQNRIRGRETLHAVPDGVGENIAKVGKGSLLDIGNEPASLEIVLRGLRDSHWLNVLLGENASLAVALADVAVRDCRTVCNAILARGRSDVHSPRPHRRARACVELLRMLDSTGLRSNPANKDIHPLLELGVVGILLASQFVGFDEKNDGPVASTRWTVEVGNLKVRRGRTTIVDEI